MKVLRNGKEVKDASVVYDAAGNPTLVQIKGDANNYDAAAFTFEDVKTVKKTKQGETGAMTTKDVPSSRKK